MKIYLDDERTTPVGWVRCYWLEEVIFFLENCAVDEVSLDHDLGDDNRGTGYDVLLWIEEWVANRNYQPPKITIHSANIAARIKMELARDNIYKVANENAKAREGRKAFDNDFIRSKIIQLCNIDSFKQRSICHKKKAINSRLKKHKTQVDIIRKYDFESYLRNTIKNCKFLGSGLLAFFYKNLVQIRDGVIPNQFVDMEDLLFWDLDELNPALRDDLYELRNIFSQVNMWALVDKQWTGRLARILEGKKALEVGSGCGYLAKALFEHGVNIIASDINPGVGAEENKCDLVFDVMQMEAVEAIKKHRHDALIISWPEYDSDMAVRCVEAVAADKLIIYIGEWAPTSRNANDDFFFSVDVEEIIEIPSWNGVRDRLYILKKRKNVLFNQGLENQ